MRAAAGVAVFLCAGLAVMQPATGAAIPIPVGQQDDFQDGTTQYWIGQAILENVATGGPAGVGDRYLKVTADQAGVKHLGLKNQEQWGGRPWVQGETTGDYVTHGITGIAMHVRNFGPDDVHLRLLLTGHGRWASNDAVVLSPGGPWQRVVFGLTEADLTQVEGSERLVNCLADMSRYVIHHYPAVPDTHGTTPVVNASIGIDNITAVPEPSALALTFLGLLGLAFCGRRNMR